MKKVFFIFLAVILCSSAFAARTIEGPFLILSTPYHSDGSVDYESLVKEARFAAKWDIPGLIWPQSNDAVDLLTMQERFHGMEVLVKEWSLNPKKTILTLGVNGDDTEEMLVYAREAERLAGQYGVDIILAARPPYYGPSKEQQDEYFDALASVAKRPVIIQTYVNDNCPAQSVESLLSLAKKYPETYGWIKEESNSLEANTRQVGELAHPEYIKTVFSAWGGWQWSYQYRENGTRGLISERVAYSPIVSYVWKCMKNGDKKGDLSEAYAMYRLVIDYRFLPYDALRGYSLYYFKRLGLFENTLSRAYEGAPDGPDKTYTRANKGKWKLMDIELSDSQKREMDKCYDDMMKFVKKHDR